MRRINRRNLAAAGAVVILAGGLAGYWVLGQVKGPGPPPATPHGIGGLQEPQVDLAALDRAADALPVPKASLEDARRRCVITRDAERCRYRDALEAHAARVGVN